MINFISNLPHDLRTGGFSAVNAAEYAVLSGSSEVNYVGPINPPAVLRQKVASKVKRLSGGKGAFHFFSRQRLRAIASEVNARCMPGAQIDFFHGFTPWIATKPDRPYLASSDCTFRDYIDTFHRRELFRAEDLSRIEETEATWLSNAARVLFTSEWAAGNAVRHYALDRRKVRVIGIFGEIEMPRYDTFAGGKEFAFIATNFEAKGGPVALAAFREVRKRHPDATLTVVGGKPIARWVGPGVTFTGFLKKENRDEFEQYRQILGRVRAIVHPTKSDIAPLLAVEAGYFGCPLISSRRFAISELVENESTGLLVDDPSQARPIAEAMKWMLECEDAYRRMRSAAWAKAREQYSRCQFEERLLSNVNDLLTATPRSR